MAERHTRSGSAVHRAVRPTARLASRRTVRSFGRYEEAEGAVEYLTKRDFPIEHVAIVGRDLHVLEQVTGRIGYGEAALRGAGGGALTGFLIGWVFGWFDWIHPLIASALLALYGLIFGAIVGALLSMAFYAVQQGRRDFSTVRMVRPSSYDLLVDESVAAEAERLLSESPIAEGA